MTPDELPPRTTKAPYRHARHYCGWAFDLDAARRAPAGDGARLVEVIIGVGRTFELAHLAGQPLPRARSSGAGWLRATARSAALSRALPGCLEAGSSWPRSTVPGSTRGDGDGWYRLARTLGVRESAVWKRFTTRIERLQGPKGDQQAQ
jgi:hypothetical protein